MNRLTRLAMVSVAALTLMGVEIVGSGSGYAKPTKPFEITKAKPNPATLTIESTPGSASSNITIHWKGTATFPVTASLTPTADCSSGDFNCYSGSTTFDSGGKKLVWEDGNNCAITTTGSGTHTGTWDLTLTDANGQVTPDYAYVVTCTWSS